MSLKGLQDTLWNHVFIPDFVRKYSGPEATPL